MIVGLMYNCECVWYHTGTAIKVGMSALVFALAELHNMSQGSSHSIAAASSSGVCSAVSCGQVKSKDVLYSDDWYNVFLVWFNK